MLWHIIKRSENDNSIFIGYSSETSKECDGLIKYDKLNGELNVEKYSLSSDEYDTGRLLPHIFTALRRNAVTDNIRTVSLG